MDGIEIFNSGKPVTLTPEQQPGLPAAYNRALTYVAYHTMPAPAPVAWNILTETASREAVAPR
jgi:hypothetical protein